MSNGSQEEKYDSSSREEVKIEDNKSFPNLPKRKTIRQNKYMESFYVRLAIF